MNSNDKSMLDTQITSSPMAKKDTRDMTIALTVMIKKLMIERNKLGHLSKAKQPANWGKLTQSNIHIQIDYRLYQK